MFRDQDDDQSNLMEDWKAWAIMLVFFSPWVAAGDWVASKLL